MFHSHVPFLGVCFPCCICIDFLGQTDSVTGESVTICSVSFDRPCARAMPHKVTELDGLAGTLLARHTVGRLSLSRDEQVGLLRNAIQCFLSYQLHRLQADGTWKQKLGVVLLAQCSSRAGDSQHVGEEPQKRRIPALGEHITKVRGRVVATKGIMRMRTCACVSVCNSFWCLYIYTCSPLIYFRYLYVCVFLSLQRTFHYPLFLRFRPNVRRRSINATQCWAAASIMHGRLFTFKYSKHQVFIQINVSFPWVLQ